MLSIPIVSSSGADLTTRGMTEPGFGPRAIRALERCHQAGARGVGELHDKGKGLSSDTVNALGMHPDDARMDSLFERCGQLGMPVNIHVADPIWMYEPMDNKNDGLMNAFHWRLDNQPNIVGHSGMIDILERTVKKHSSTTFIACHFANLDYDLERLGQTARNGTPTCMPILPRGMRKQRPFPVLQQSFMPSIRTVCSMALTWDSINRCIGLPSEFSRHWTSTSTKPTCSVTTGA